MTTLKTILWCAVLVLIVDFVGFVAWAFSGQYPVDDFYIGSITMHIILFFS